MNIIIAGLAKNCEKSLDSNLVYLDYLNSKYKEKIKLSIFIVENDSNDNTKLTLQKHEEKDFIYSFCLDGLDSEIKNRIERITYCRNFLIEKISKSQISLDDSIYISADFDLDLFSQIPVNNFLDYVYNFHNQKTFTAIFPNSIPFYYDIHALRKEKWNNVDAWDEYNKISKFVPIGKFFIRYFLIYRKQRKILSNEKLISVDSAFGGFGFYKVSKKFLSELSYDSNTKYSLCEHIDFNSNFKCAIYTSLNVEAPSEHIEFKLLPFSKKIVYVVSSLLSDSKSLIKSLKRYE
jgi:hypothetical protein